MPIVVTLTNQIKIKMNMVMVIGLSSIALIALVVLYFQTRVNALKTEKQAAQNMLDHQLQLTDAYAWEVESKRYELMQALIELKKAHENTMQVNQRLEEEVSKRTNALLVQNQKIIDYQFINAHKLRAPVARILGLTSLLQKSTETECNSLLLQHLVSSAQDLDEIVHTIQQTLYAADYIEQLKSA